MLGRETLEEDLLRGLLDAAPVALLLVDGGGHIVFASAKCEAMFGYARVDLLAKSFSALVPGGDWEALAADPGAFSAGLTRGGIDERPLLARKKSGEEFPVEVSLNRLANHRDLLLAVAVRDTSTRKRTVEALHKSESNFRALFDQAPEGVFIADPDGRCTDVNTAASQMLGYERVELLGRTVFDILTGEDTPRLIDAREGSLAPGWVEVWEWTLKRKDGAFVPVELTSKTLPDGRWQAFVRDISRRRQRDEELRRVTNLLDSIIETVPTMIFMKDAADLRFARFNRAGEDLLGIPRDAILGKSDYDLFPEEQAEAFQARDRETLTERKLVVIPEEPIRTADGTRWLHTMKIPIVDGMGTPVYLLGISLDVTDRLRAERELEHLRAEWGSIVAHDLRQPLQSIALSAQILARTTDDSSLQKYIERIRSAAERLHRMVADLMDFSRLDAHRLELVRKPVDVPTVVLASVERMALQAPDRPFDVKIEDNAPRADADPDRIAQVMENLLTNAIKYGNPETRIAVRVTHENRQVAVAVTNQGKALTAEELPRLFERFHRTVGARQGNAEGVGLGLYISRALVEAHGGRITAESTPAGATTFRFTLPVAGP
jgi:PAS domain S-box-containing protein